MQKTHGKSSVVEAGDIIIVILQGSFNSLGVTEYACKLKTVVDNRQGRPFAMLVNDLEIEGGTPEAYDELEIINKWMNTKPLIAKAFVLNSEITKQIILKRTPSLTSQNINFFIDENQATAWLNQMLADHNNTKNN